MSHTDSNPEAIHKPSKKQLVFYAFLFGLIVLFLVVSYFILEFATKKVLEAQRGSSVVSFWQNDDLLAQSLKPNSESMLTNGAGEFNVSIKTTSQGFRDIREYQIPKPKDTIRILMLGDSFTFGHGVEIEQTFSKVLETYLNNAYGMFGKKFEIINAGYASGFTWDEYYLFLKERGLKYQPDVVLINTWVGNDLTDIVSHIYPEQDELGLPLKIVSKTTFVDDYGFLEAIPPPIEIRPGFIGIKDRLNVLCDKSLFCKTVIWPHVSSTTKAISHLDTKSEPPPPPPLTLLKENPLAFFGPMLFMINFLPAKLEPAIEAAWETGQKMLLASKEISAAAHAQLMIVNIPIKLELYDKNGVFDNQKLFNRNRLETFAREAGIPFCSPLAALKQELATTYFLQDSHLTARGHEIVAAVIDSCISLPFTQKK